MNHTVVACMYINGWVDEENSPDGKKRVDNFSMSHHIILIISIINIYYSYLLLLLVVVVVGVDTQHARAHTRTQIISHRKYDIVYDKFVDFDWINRNDGLEKYA